MTCLTLGRAGHLLPSILLVSAALAAPVQDAAPPAAPPARVVEGAVDVYQFSPEESFDEVDPERTSLRAVLEALGEDAIAWHQHVVTLSNPYFEGREPGSAGIERAADYLEYWMTRIGLDPAFSGGYRQTFEMPSRAREVLFSALAVGGEALEEGRDFVLLANSGGGEVSGSVAFVGYGIEDGPDGHDDLAGAGDLAGRVVVVLRYEPLDEEGRSRWSERRFSEHSSLSDKFSAIAKAGAAAILLVNPPGVAEGAKDLELPRRGGLGPQLSIPAFIVSPAVAARLLASLDPSPETRGDLLEWRRLADQGMPFGALAGTPASVRAVVEVRDGVPTSNLGGVLPGAGPLASEWVVLGAHYDHIGMKQEDGVIEVNPGADDNASGTAAMLVLAARLRALAEEGSLPEPRRSVLFLAFTAEESGLNGSRYFVQNPTVPADRINAMINLDMIGRLRSDEILVGGVRTAEGFLDRLRPRFEESGLLVRADPSGRGPSDHSMFHGAGIPVLFFFTGVHESYHRPGDRGHTVNPAGAAKVMGLVEAVLMDLLSGERLRFSSGDAAATPDRGYAGVRLGVQPGLSDGEGVKVEAVSEGTSAADAGIVAGDVILSWDGTLLMGAGDLMSKLRSHEPGDVVTLVVVRDGKEQEVKVTLKASGGARRGN